MESPLPPGADGGQAPDLPADFAPDLPRESRYLRQAVLDAMRDAGALDRLPCAPNRAGILLGTTLHGMRAGGKYFRSGDPAALKDFLSASVIQNACGDLPLRGCGITTCSACSSSLGAIALAVTLVRNGQFDLILAGGYDAISEYVYGGFNSLRLVASGLPRPFTRDRQGMKLAEGYGIVALERAADAMARGARPMAAILGYGESADAHHLTQPHPQGQGAARAMRQALAAAKMTPADIDLIAAHATGTPDNDASEFAALSKVFGGDLPRVPVVAFKSHLGHTLGGAGVVELILAAKALQEQIVPACANISAEDVEFAGLNVSTGKARSARIRATLNTSLGFGGANTCVILGLPAEGEAPAEPRSSSAPRLGWDLALPSQEVLITGIGVLLPGAIGNDAFLRKLIDGSDAFGGEIPEADIAPLLNVRRIRRMSQYVKLSLAATMLCLRDAGIENVAPFAETWAAVLGTMHGSTGYCEQYYGQIVREGIAAANPMLFAEGVPNAAAAHLSLMLSLRGPCQTVIGSRTAGLDAIRLAAARIAAGEWERAIVGAAEEFSPTVNAAHARWRADDSGACCVSSGAVMFLLESRPAMQSRGGRARGEIMKTSGGVARGGGQIARLAGQAIRSIGSPSIVLGSGNGTWIDRAERIGAARAAERLIPAAAAIGECYSVVPMAAVAGVLLKDQFSIFGTIGVDPAGAVAAAGFQTHSR